MTPFLLVLRFFVFVVVLSLNCILLPFAVITRSEVGAQTPVGNYEAYLVALSALSIIAVLSFGGIAVFRRNAVPSRTAFETLWVGILWVLHLSSASTASAIHPTLQCSSSGQFVPVQCIHSTGMQVFSWTVTAFLLIYLCVLVITAIVRSARDPFVWSRDVRDLSRYPHQEVYNTHRASSSTATFGLRVKTDGLTATGPYGLSARSFDKGRSFDSMPMQMQVVVSQDVRTVNDRGESRRTSHVMSPASSHYPKDPAFSDWVYPAGLPSNNGYPTAASGGKPDHTPATAGRPTISTGLSLYPKHLQPLMDRHNQFAV